uniref:Uncharacterized protein LOC104230437 n=1 Tax=Nicotiana sylvestris TaxID=4096 RepID=A0A1U7X512_NICSY|nr:PREDICTED: uncharacterized protein LOC104230437 [Nicotiana sylvestris]
MQNIIVVGAELPLGLIQVALSVLGSIARDLLLKRVEIQHQVSCICTSIHMVMMEKLLLLRNLESYMRYYNNKYKLNLILISVKYIIKPHEEKRKEEYMVLDIKQNATMGEIFMVLLDLMLHRQQNLQILNQHRQGIWMS